MAVGIIYTPYLKRDYVIHARNRDYEPQGIDLVKDALFVFEDNDERSGYGGQARYMRDQMNTFGIRVKKSPYQNYSDSELTDNIHKILEDLKELSKTRKKIIVFPDDGIGRGRGKLEDVAPDTYGYLQMELARMGIRNGPDFGRLYRKKVRILKASIKRKSIKKCRCKK